MTRTVITNQDSAGHAPGLPIRPTPSSRLSAPLSPKLISDSSPTSVKTPSYYAQPFCDFLTENPTVFHAVAATAAKLRSAGFTKLSERESWQLKKGGKYFVERNGSSLIAFRVGSNYKVPNGVAMIAGHVDALTCKLKPIPKLESKEGFVQIGVAPYAGGLNSTWWDRDLGIAGRVLVKDDSGKVVTKLVNLNAPIARIPTLAPHFGAASIGPFNTETQMVPIVGLESAEKSKIGFDACKDTSKDEARTFTSTQPPRLVKAIADRLEIKDHSKIISWELELYDVQPAQLGGFDKELIYGGRIDDKLCSWSAIEALLASDSEFSAGIIKCVGLFDDEEIGSLLRQGAKGNFMPITIERIVDSFSPVASQSVFAQTYANSFLISADVTHAVNPNFLNAYLAKHAPRLNVGVAISADPNGHMTTDAVSVAILETIAKKCDSELQIFQIRNDSRSGGTVGPMLSSKMGVRAIDAGIPQLSMHSIRATTGALDPGLGVKLFKGFFDYYELVDTEFRET